MKLPRRYVVTSFINPFYSLTLSPRRVGKFWRSKDATRAAWMMNTRTRPVWVSFVFEDEGDEEEFLLDYYLATEAEKSRLLGLPDVAAPSDPE